MSGDIAVVWDAESARGDWKLLEDGDLLLAPPMETAVIVSIFTDRLAELDDDLGPGETDRRGWWATGLDGKPIGSRLWLLRRAKREAETLKRARDYIREALAWMIEEGLAVSVDVQCEWQDASRIAAAIGVNRADGSRAAVTAAWAWQGI